MLLWRGGATQFSKMHPDAQRCQAGHSDYLGCGEMAGIRDTTTALFTTSGTWGGVGGRWSGGRGRGREVGDTVDSLLGMSSRSGKWFDVSDECSEAWGEGV